MDINVNFLINAAFTAIMFALFIWDFRSFKSETHKDFKSSIMSLGVLGTFVGIFVGLLGFDTADITGSVPILLEGLKVAFYTSILGMGLAIALSVFQRSKNIKTSDEEKLDFIVERIENLRFLKELPGLTESGFKGVESALRDALNSLSQGANKELIAALESVIRDFNQNLTSQFGENFKELNAGILRLISWQENYKRSVESFEKALEDSLNKSMESMKNSAELLSQIVLDKQKIMDFYSEITSIIQSYNAQNSTLKAQLESIALLGENATAALNNINAVNSATSEVFETLQNSIKDTKVAFIDSVNSAKNELVLGVKNAGEDLARFYAESLESTTKETKNHLENILNLIEQNFAQSHANTAELHEKIAQNHKNILLGFSQHLLSLESQHKKSLDLTTQTLQDMEEAHIATLKSYAVATMSELQELQNTQLNSAREMAANFDKAFLAQYDNLTKYLKLSVVDFIKVLKKLSEESAGVPRSVGQKVITEFGNLQKNMLENFNSAAKTYEENLSENLKKLADFNALTNENLSTAIAQNNELRQSLNASLKDLDSALSENTQKFKNDYEWFLLRVRELLK